jgi:hypothetical protein
MPDNFQNQQPNQNPQYNQQYIQNNQQQYIQSPPNHEQYQNSPNNNPQAGSFSPYQLSQLKNLQHLSQDYHQQQYQSNPVQQQTQYQNYQGQHQPFQNQTNPQQFQDRNQEFQNQNTNPGNAQPLNSDFGISFNQPEVIQNNNPADLVNKVKFNPIQSIKSSLNKFRTVIFVLISLLLICAVGFGAFMLLSKPAPVANVIFDKISASIIAPVTLPQGTSGKWSIKIRNDQNFSIDDVQLEMKYDQDFQTTNFPNYKPTGANNIFNVGKLDGVGVGTQEAVVDIEGFLNAQIDVETIMSGTLKFSAIKDNGSKSDQKLEVAIPIVKTKVTSPEVQLTITPAVGAVQNGGEAEFIIKVKNTKENDYQDLRLRLNYPAGNIFTYTSSQFTASNTSQKITTPNDGDDTWYISRLAGLSEQILSVKGKVAVKSEQKVPLKATLSKKSNSGDYKDLKIAVKDILVTNQPIIITTSMEKGEKTFTGGETLKVNIDYFNQSQETLKNVEILGFVNDKSNLLDLNSIAFVGGDRAFINNSQIQWTGNNTPQLVSLAPQSKGQLSYTINVKKDILTIGKKQSEYVIKPQVQIKAINLQEIVASGDEYKMSSNFKFAQAETQNIKIERNTNTNKQRYKLVWDLFSEQNEINNIVIKTRTSLPPSAFIKESIIKPDNSQLTYNPSDGQILFKMDKIDPYTGFNGKKPIEISFEFEIDQQSTNLIDAPITTANDSFTGQNFKLTGKASETKN